MVFAYRVRGVSTSAHHPIETPTVGDALQLVLTGVLERRGPSPRRGPSRSAETKTSDGPARAPTRAPIWTASPPTVAVDHLDLAGVEAGTDLDPEARTASTIACAHCTPRAGPSNVARNPSPVVSISRAPIPSDHRPHRLVVALEQHPSTRRHRASAARSVEPTMSVNSTVASTESRPSGAGSAPRTGGSRRGPGRVVEFEVARPRRWRSPHAEPGLDGAGDVRAVDLAGLRRHQEHRRLDRREAPRGRRCRTTRARSSFATSGVQVLRLALATNRTYSSVGQGPPITFAFSCTNSRAHATSPIDPRARAPVRCTRPHAPRIIGCDRRPGRWFEPDERRTRSGYVAASSTLDAPDSSIPPNTARSTPTASRTANVSATCVSRFPGATFRLESPTPRRSWIIRRAKSANPSRQARPEASPRTRRPSRQLFLPEDVDRSLPNVWYAR